MQRPPRSVLSNRPIHLDELSREAGRGLPGSRVGGCSRGDRSKSRFKADREPENRLLTQCIRRLSFPAYTASPRMYTAKAPLAATLPSVAPRTALGLPELVHLGDALLELDVLALLVGVSLVLRQAGSVARCPCPSQRPPKAPSSSVARAQLVPRTSTAGSTSRTDTG